MEQELEIPHSLRRDYTWIWPGKHRTTCGTNHGVIQIHHMFQGRSFFFKTFRDFAQSDILFKSDVLFRSHLAVYHVVTFMSVTNSSPAELAQASSLFMVAKIA